MYDLMTVHSVLHMPYDDKVQYMGPPTQFQPGDLVERMEQGSALWGSQDPNGPRSNLVVSDWQMGLVLAVGYAEFDSSTGGSKGSAERILVLDSVTSKFGWTWANHVSRRARI